jgi:aminoglycoside 6'-N-acetyltransferase I
MEIKFRPIEINDLDSAVDEMVLAYRSAPWNERWTIEEGKQRFMAILAKKFSYGYVALDNESNQIIATCVGHLEYYLDKVIYWIDDFSVRTDYQDKGIGTGFLFYVKKEMKRLKVTEIRLMTLRDYPSEKFFKSNGFDSNRESVQLKITL